MHYWANYSKGFHIMSSHISLWALGYDFTHLVFEHHCDLLHGICLMLLLLHRISRWVSGNHQLSLSTILLFLQHLYPASSSRVASAGKGGGGGVDNKMSTFLIKKSMVLLCMHIYIHIHIYIYIYIYIYSSGLTKVSVSVDESTTKVTASGRSNLHGGVDFAFASYITSNILPTVHIYIYMGYGFSLESEVDSHEPLWLMEITLVLSIN